MEALVVADPATLEPAPKDGRTMGEILVRGNTLMKGYLKNEAATEEAFRGGWFHTGDLGVWDPDGYVRILDRSKDIIISGGENISSLEVESIMYRLLSSLCLCLKSNTTYYYCYCLLAINIDIIISIIF